jgi:hypothetical protein
MENKMERIELICEKESLLDYMWLFNNIPWSNFDSKNATISYNTPIEAYAIDVDGADTNIIGVKKFYFDNVIITAFHATVNHFSFIFSLSGEKTYTTNDYTTFGYSIDEIKNHSIEKLNSRIKGLKWQINNNEVAIDKIKELS